jgi:squalene-hopene/tetraprenyl-beta-curcumene cyclase
MSRLGSAWKSVAVVLGVVCASQASCAPVDDAGASAAAMASPDEVAAVLRSARADTMALAVNDGSGPHWNMPAYLGHHYVAQYYLVARWLGIPTKIDPSRLQEALFAAQRPDGSWEQVHDATMPIGDLSATVTNYAALKAMGVSFDHPRMALARAFVLAHGGAGKINVLSKFVFAMFGVFRWNDVTPLGWKVPRMLAEEGLFGQWTGPHLRAMAYLRAREVRKDLGESFQLAELFPRGKATTFDRSPAPEVETETLEYVLDFVGRGEAPDRGQLYNAGTVTDPRGLHATRQQPGGSWGAYTLSTLLTMACLDDYARWVGDHKDSRFSLSNPAMVQSAITKGAEFVSSIYMQDANDAVPYKGPTMDGQIWDSALIAGGLLEAGQPQADVKPTLDYLVRQQVVGLGGFPFGKDFYYAPDTDDTAEVVLALLGHGRYEKEAAAALAWVLRMQNDDGGWAAFSKNNSGTVVTRNLMSFAADSVAPFDESCPDVTGHILEALGRAGQTVQTSDGVRRAVAYLQSTQSRDGTWTGRWGVNRIYGTGAAIVGLTAVGVPASDPMIAKGILWLRAQQNADGGFGETMHSYEKPDFHGASFSTPTQTSWVLLAFLAAGDRDSTNTKSAVGYLVRNYREHGLWSDPSSIGTGHPGVVYMHYPSYAIAFTLTALGRYVAPALRTP